MFRSSTILRELVHSLVKVKLQLKHSVKLLRCILCGDVAATWKHTTLANSQQTDIHAPGGKQTHNLSKQAALDLRLRPRGASLIYKDVSKVPGEYL